MKYIAIIFICSSVYGWVCIFLHRRAVKKLQIFFEALLVVDRLYLKDAKLQKWKYHFALLCEEALEWEKSLKTLEWYQLFNPFFINCLDELESFEKRLKKLSQVGTLIDSQKDQGNQQSSSCP
jgi:hypothetical protein